MKAILIFFIRIKFTLLSYFSPEKAVKEAVKLFFTPRRHAMRKVEHEIKETALKKELSSGAIYYSWGEGKPVVFIHGWEGRSTQVSSILKELKDEYKVIAVDAPAHGDSPGIMSHPGLFVDTLFELIEEVGPVHAIIGHSMGGGSAVYAAIKGIEAERIISIAGPSNFFDIVDNFAKFIGLQDKARFDFLSFSERFVGIPYRQMTPEDFTHNPTPSLLVLHDELDKEINVQHATSYEKNLPNIKVEISKGLGHRKILHAEKTVNKVSEFLKT